MGMPPREVDKLSLWEFMACAEAWETAHMPESERPMTREQFEEAAALLKRVEKAG